VVSFLDLAGRVRTLHFHRQPLGMVLAEAEPTLVEGFEFNSYARDRGVLAGWRILHVGSVEASGCKADGELSSRLVRASAHLMPWPVRMDFRTPDGAVRTIYFEQQPLGMELAERRGVLRVSLFEPDSYAKACGVCLGWAVLRVGDAPVGAAGDYPALLRRLGEALTPLPQERKGLKIEFCDEEGATRVFFFQRWPLGVVFAGGGRAAVRVQRFEFNSYAKLRGLQAGWTVTRLGERAPSSWLSLDDFEEQLDQHAQGLAPWPLRMDFEAEGGDMKVFYLERQPQGLEFSSRPPFRIRNLEPETYVNDLGLATGWTVLRVGDVPVARGVDRDQLMAYLAHGSAHLPP